ncbi:mitotic spindle assembly checkpoint protein MAD2A-like [Malaya genurostris]|uniref:mitotic spindle assembly checkpoint protein MAD2A-like n=1 Tax=Malaya genurostris TaxID=325434 RepID=UPI0026F39F90|nr:mitotic spindle assembly checkpoint protein MAD2A-like [Malaya genurostris]
MATSTQHGITLKGSTAIVREYLHYSMNSILYQRNVYPPEKFTSKKQYGIPVLVLTNEEIVSKLKGTLDKLENCINCNNVRQIILAITNKQTTEVLERWEFDIHNESPANNATKMDQSNPVSTKELKKIQAEIRAVMLQITSSVSFLPLHECSCAFEILVHFRGETPPGWSPRPNSEIQDAQNVQLKSFSTGLHKVDTTIQYKNVD